MEPFPNLAGQEEDLKARHGVTCPPGDPSRQEQHLREAGETVFAMGNQPPDVGLGLENLMGTQNSGLSKAW